MIWVTSKTESNTMSNSMPTLSNLESIIKYIEKDYIGEEIDDKLIKIFVAKYIGLTDKNIHKLPKKLRNIFLDREQICELMGMLNLSIGDLILAINRIFPGFFTTKLKHYIHDNFDYQTGQALPEAADDS